MAQITVLHFVRFHGGTFSPVLIAVVWYAVASDARRAALYGLAAGFFEDMLSTGTGGAWTLATTLTAIIAGAAARGFFADSIPILAAIVFAASLVHDLLFWLVMEAQGYPTGLGWLHFHQALWRALLNSMLVVAIMLVLRLRDQRNR